MEEEAEEEEEEEEEDEDWRRMKRRRGEQEKSNNPSLGGGEQTCEHKHRHTARVIPIGPLIVSHRTRVIQIVPLIVSHRSRDTNNAITIWNKLQIVLFAPGPNGREFSLRRKSDTYLGRLSWGTQLTRTFLVKYLGKLS